MKNLVILLITSLFGFSIHAQDYRGKDNRTVEQKLNDEYCSGLFQSAEGTIIDVASNPTAQSYFNILEWLQGRVVGLQVYKNRSGTSIPVIRGGVPAIFIDEIQISPQRVEMINTNDIAIIKVIRMPFYGGFNAGHGAIAIYTKGGEEEEEVDDSK